MNLKRSSNPGNPPRNAPKAVIEIFHRATEELRQSGLAERRSVLRQLFLTGQAVRPLPKTF
jgi:hypothetical protein